MAMFFKRSPGYRVGLTGLFVFSSLYFLSYVTPFWICAEEFGTEANLGLWQMCVLDKCTYFGVHNLQPWFHMSRMLGTLALGILLMGCLYGVVSNCCLPDPKYTRGLEACGVIGGVLGFSGAMTFVGTFRSFELQKPELCWSFTLAVTGSTGVLLSSLLLVASNKASLVVPSRQRVVTDSRDTRCQPPASYQCVVVHDWLDQYHYNPSAHPVALGY